MGYFSYHMELTHTQALQTKRHLNTSLGCNEWPSGLNSQRCRWWETMGAVWIWEVLPMALSRISTSLHCACKYDNNVYSVRIWQRISTVTWLDWESSRGHTSGRVCEGLLERFNWGRPFWMWVALSHELGSWTEEEREEVARWHQQSPLSASWQETLWPATGSSCHHSYSHCPCQAFPKCEPK